MHTLLITFPLLSGFAFSGLIRCLGYKGKIVQLYALLLGTLIVSPLVHYFIFITTNDLILTILLGWVYMAVFSLIRVFKYAPGWDYRKQPDGKWGYGFKYQYRLLPGM